MAALLGLSACNATLPPVPKETLIPIPVPCLTRQQIPAQDFLPDAVLKGLDDFQFIIALRQDQLKHREWVAQTISLLEACVR